MADLPGIGPVIPEGGMVTDAVTQSNVTVLGQAPAIAMGNLYASLAHSTGILLQNSVASASQSTILAQATTNMGVMQIYSANTTAGASATEKVAQAGTADQLSTLLTTLRSFNP
ncbi:Killing trait [Pseudovibrio sp. W64]|uniref:Killing trait domain-containing protein n=2 Tax=Stappiaceae TaxID=2821832 RepID=A0A1I4G2Y9_9HYPH|nr:Killing trait [Pseudovibrio sp. Ad46]KZK81454.1 Killing trait [Pseudovibrio sp. Ad13]KZK83737.1 Killing trait [Pseudovibrio sp. W64]KZK93253.1 Killing trait [Pseudovibrio sp. W74]KZK93597.1 Killing trait [Pseudovibrio sp. Ad5]KZL07144.1 Killing trait [Pseudovibrio sp. Ad14]SFL24465.1 Killing trait domain-containing protein [Pseudovibrio ascidiaceicola]